MFNSIRKSIASFIAPTSVQISVPAGTKSLTTPTIQQIPMHVRTQPDRAWGKEMVVGKFHVSHLELMNSNYLKDAIAQLGAWAALARVFSEFEKVHNKKNADFTKYQQLLNEFHAWNAATSTEKQMNEETVILTLDRLADPVVPKGNKETDAIIARVRKITIEEVQAERIAQAEKKSAIRKDMLNALQAEIWKFDSDDIDPFLSSTKVAAKAVQTLEWIAKSWQGEPASIAAELLLIEADIKVIEELAKKEEGHTNEGPMEVSGDYSKPEYQADPSKELSTKAKLDKKAFQEWQATQQD